MTLFVATAEQILLAESSLFLSIESVNADLVFPLVDASIQRNDLNTSQLQLLNSIFPFVKIKFPNPLLPG